VCSCDPGSPVDVGITMHVSSVSSISEVNMVRTYRPRVPMKSWTPSLLGWS